MKYSSSLKCVPVVAVLLMLVSCGGGDDAEAGSPEELHTAPTDYKREGSSASGCSILENAVYVKVSGGAAPYRIFSSFPNDIVPTPTVVNKPNESFTVSLRNGRCVDPATITVVDALNKETTLTISNVPAAAASAAS